MSNRGGRKAQASGVVGERAAELTLRTLGVDLVEQIATPSIVVRGRKKYIGKVSGDRRGVLSPNGRSVHAEVKKYKTKNLAYSVLKPHQRDWLTRHAEAGGLSLLIWVAQDDIYVMKWRVDGIPGFMEERSSISPELAASLDLASLEEERLKVYPGDYVDKHEKDCPFSNNGKHYYHLQEITVEICGYCDKTREDD